VAQAQQGDKTHPHMVLTERRPGCLPVGLGEITQ